MFPIDAVQDHSAFQPVVRSEIPSGVHAIDFLVDQKLSRHGLEPTKVADERTLILRSVYDLHGLPLPMEQMEIFREELSRLVRTLLESR